MNPIVPSIEIEIRQCLVQFNNMIPERYAIAWAGYLAGIFMHKVISLEEYIYLVDMLPEIEDNPVISIFRGFGDD